MVELAARPRCNALQCCFFGQSSRAASHTVVEPIAGRLCTDFSCPGDQAGFPKTTCRSWQNSQLNRRRSFSVFGELGTDYVLPRAALPTSAAAPRVGQRVLDFTLADTSGRRISFDQLFAPAADDPQATAP